jgi:hypothetical protein
MNNRVINTTVMICHTDVRGNLGMPAFAHNSGVHSRNCPYEDHYVV